MTENATPTPEQVAADNAAASAKAQENLTSQIDALAKQIETGTLRLAAANTPAPVAPQPVAVAPLTEAEMTEIAESKGVGAVLTEHTKRVTGPAFLALLAQNASLKKDIAKGDPALSKIFKKYGKEIDAKIRELGVNDAYLAEKGYGDVARLVAAEHDPTLLMPEAPAPVAQPQPAPAPKPAPVQAPAPAPAAPVAVEGVYNGPVTPTPAPNRTVEDAIRAVPVERREVDFVRDVFDMTEADLKKQRYEMEQNMKKYGEDGLKRIGGMPVCSFSDIGLPEPR